MSNLCSFFAISLALIGLSFGNEINFKNITNIKWENDGEKTMFIINAKLPNSVVNDTNNAWISVGINDMKRMENLNCIVCQNTAGISSVMHYTTQDTNPLLFDTSRPSIALSDAQMGLISNNDGTTNITCSFKRDNIMPSDLILKEANTRYLEIGIVKEYFVMAAWGSGNFGFHQENRAHSRELLSFASRNEELTPTAETETTEADSNMITTTVTPEVPKPLNIIHLIWKFIKSILSMFITI